MAAKCECGCGQAPARSCRLRKAECRGCGYVVRVTREWIGKGLPVCSCGEPLECPCLDDRCYLPGDEGREAASEAWGIATEFERRSVNAKRAMRLRRRCKCCPKLVSKGELYCSSHKSESMPF